MLTKFESWRSLMRLDRRVWLPTIFGLPLVAIFAIYCNSNLFRTAQRVTSETISFSPVVNASSTFSLAHNTTSESTRSSHFLYVPSTSSSLPRVTIWSPPPCNGSFVSDPAPHSKEGFPYAIIRDAVIDRRPVSHRQYREAHDSNSFQRIILYLSVHLSVSLTRDNAKVSLLSIQNQPVPGVIIRVDYVQRADPFLLTGSYKPGKVTEHGYQVSECQVAISLAPEQPMPSTEFDKHVQHLSTSGSKVELHLVLKRFDGERIMFNPSFDLACTTAWEHSDVFPPLNHLQKPTCHTDVDKTTGAVVFCGAALYGKKKVDPRHYAEIAHFGARALGGPIRFDAVVMGVVVNNSVADRRLCTNEICVDDMNRKNRELLEDVREVVEAEFDAVGFDRSLWSNLILVPFCRLGSDASKTELADPCKLSDGYGQYHASFLAYAMLAPYFKWAASYDLDEFFAIRPQHSKFPEAQAAKVLDDVNKGGRNYMYFTWLNFGVRSNSSRSLTKEVLNSRELQLRHKKTHEEFDCLQLTRDPTGKAVVRCDTGIGFTIHRPVIRKHGEAFGILGQTQGEIRKTQLRTWHPRLGRSRGECVYVERE